MPITINISFAILVTFTIILAIPIKTKTCRFADIPLENFACPPEIVASSRYVEANIGDDDGSDGDYDSGDDDNGSDDGDQ